MSNNIVKHGQLEDIAGDLWTKAKKRDITALEYEADTKTIKGKNPDNPSLAISAQLTDLVSINDRAKFKKDVSVDKAGTANNLHIGTLDGDQSQNRILGYRGLTSASFVDNYVSELIVYAKSDLAENTQTNWNVWAIKKSDTKEQDTVKATFHKNNVQVKAITINGRAEKCVRFAIDREFDEEVYFMVRCVSHQVKTSLPSNTHKPDVVNISEPPGDREGQTFSWTTNEPNNTAIMHLVGRESISSLAEKLRKTQANSIVTKVNNIAPGADGNVVVNADNIKYNADTNAKTVKAVLDEKVSNITLKANDKKKLEITKATGATADVDLTEAFKANNVTYGKQIAGANKATVEDAIDALVAENGKSVKTIKNGRPNAQGDIDVTVAEGGATGITMTFGTGGTALKIVSYMTNEEVNEIKALFV